MFDIVLAGCGAVGSRLALEVAAPGLSFLLIDDDRVDGNNVRSGSTIFWSQHIGCAKVTALAEMLYRRFGCEGGQLVQTLDEALVRHYNGFSDARLVIDGFDNVAARRLLTGLSVPTLHVGVSATGTGIVAWNEKYEFPEAAPARGENPVCTHQLGRGIITFTATVAALIVQDFLTTGNMRSVITTRTLGVYDL